MRSALVLVALSIVAKCCALMVSPATAQPSFTPSDIQRALQNQNLQQQPDADRLRPNVQMYQPSIPEQAPIAPPSRLEMLYSQRAGRRLEQFGYNILGVPTQVSVAQVGAVQENYVLGEGDEVVVVTRGQDNQTYRERVDREGQIVLPRLNPVRASGRTFGQLRQDIIRQIAGGSISTSAFVSLGEVRQISVFITGDVRAPGVRIMSAFSTAVDALLLSGGIAKTGSLRHVTLLRDGQSINLDLYSLLLQAGAPNVGALRNGDRIFVPSLKNTVAVTGFVRRPGIYELKENRVAAADLMQLAGGIEIAGSYRFSKTRLEPDGSTRLVPISQNAEIMNGEVLFVDSGNDLALERVTLAGAVKLSGGYPRTTAGSVAQLVRNLEALTPEAYTAFAVILRRDPKLNVRTLVPFSLVRVFAGQLDIPLQNDDAIYIFDRDQIRVLADAAANERDSQGRPGLAARPNGNTGTVNAQNPDANPLGVPLGPNQPGPNQPGFNQPSSNEPIFNQPGFNQTSPNQNQAGGANLGGNQNSGTEDLRIQGARQQTTTASAAIAQAAAAESANAFTGRSLSQPLRAITPESIAQILRVPTQALVRTVADHLIWVVDEVRDPGPYAAGEGTTLAEMLQTAGGVLRGADLSLIEVTSTQIDAQSGRSTTQRSQYKANVDDLQRVRLQSLDVVRLRAVFSDRESGRITILGQVRYPGTFDITRGERLSSVLDRAGGLTQQAYPLGAVFTRQSAATAEREARLRQSHEIQAQLASFNPTNPADTNEKDRLIFLNSLAQELRDEPVLGRIGITADPAILRVKPDLDPMVEPGDTLYIPQRPSTVTVSGEVLNSGSFQYGIGLKVSDYVKAAGGITQSADGDRIFVVFPDGSAQPASRRWLSFDSAGMIPPGSTVIVPRDLRPFNLTVFLRDATQIVSQIAITAASLAVVQR